MTETEARRRHHVTDRGHGSQPMVFAHGFGCDQQMWRFVAPAFLDTHRVVLFDHIGCGQSDPRAYDAHRHAALEGYAQDVCDLLEALDLRNVIFVGHSVSAMIGLLASVRTPDRFARLILIGPSPRYLDDPPGYHGGFAREDIDALAEMMQLNLVGWADYLSKVVIVGDVERAEELKVSFCSADPDITQRFAAATFLADNRADLEKVTVPALVVQIANDAVAPPSVGQYCHERLRGSTLVTMPVSGHCPHLTHPVETISLMRDYLGRPAP